MYTMTKKKIFLMRPFVGEEELARIQEVFDTKYLTEGPVTKEFEAEFAAFVEAKHGIAVTSCMTGLDLALKALNIGSGDEVIVPDFTHPATGDCVYLAGAEAVLADVDLDSYNIDPAEMEKAITEKTKCIIPVSWGGNPIDPGVYRIAGEHNIPVLEDAACSSGAELGGKKVGSLAAMTCFSFHPRKIITTGEGGMITTNDDELAEKAVALKHFGQTKDGRFTYHGTNYKMSNITSAIGREQLKKLPGILKDRIGKAERYSDLLESVPGIRTPTVQSCARHIFQSYCIRIEREGIRDRLRTDLAGEGIETQIGTFALHLEPSYATSKRVGTLENSANLYRNLLTLPLHHELSEDDQDFVVDCIRRSLQSYGVNA